MLRGCKGGYFASRFAFLPSLPEISELTLHPLFSTWRRLCWQGNGNERLGLQNIEEKSCFQTRVSVWETWCQAELCTSNLWPLSPRKTSPITGHHPEVSGKSCHIDSIEYDLSPFQYGIRHSLNTVWVWNQLIYFRLSAIRVCKWYVFFFFWEKKNVTHILSRSEI